MVKAKREEGERRLDDQNKQRTIMEWYELYYHDIYRFILYMIGDQNSCEDLVHDTFVRAYTSLERFEHRSNPKTWLFSIARHLVIDEIRRRKGRKFLSAVGLTKDIPTSFNIETYVENKEEVSQLMRAIQELKPNYRIVVTLSKIEGFSTKEVAIIQEWSEAKVRKTLSRALQAIRREAAKHNE